jgi:tetratricopeptide (TPR) repeat protein
MGHVADQTYDRERARQLYQQSLALHRVLGDRWMTAHLLEFLAMLTWHMGAYDESRQLDREELAVRQALGDRIGTARTLMGMGITALAQWRLDEAEPLVREAAATLQETGDPTVYVSGIRDLGSTLVWLGEFVEGYTLLERSLQIYTDLGWQWAEPHVRLCLGMAELHLGRYAAAGIQMQMVLASAKETQGTLAVALSLFYLGCVALAEEKHFEAESYYQESLIALQEIGQSGQVTYSLAGLGSVALGLGDIRQAEQRLCAALRAIIETRGFRPSMYVLPAVAMLLAEQGKTEQAVELYALTSRYRLVANSRWFEDVFGRHIAAVAATLPPEVVAAAQERGKARDLEATVEELLVELEAIDS